MSEKNSVLETPETALENKKKDIGLYNKAKEVLEKTESDATEEQPLTENELGNNIEIPIPFRPRVFKSVINYSDKLICDMYNNLCEEEKRTIEVFDIRQEFDNFDLYSMIFNLLCLSKLLYTSNIDKYDYMLENSKNHMDSIALTFEGKKITYEELFESINKYAKVLYSKGVRKGDLIGVCTLNTPEAVYLLYALIITSINTNTF